MNQLNYEKLWLLLFIRIHTILSAWDQSAKGTSVIDFMSFSLDLSSLSNP